MPDLTVTDLVMNHREALLVAYSKRDKQWIASVGDLHSSTQREIAYGPTPIAAIGLLLALLGAKVEAPH